jgi:hypothetical protein
MNVLIVNDRGLSNDSEEYINIHLTMLKYGGATTGHSFDLIVLDRDPCTEMEMDWLSTTVRPLMNPNCMVITSDQKSWDILKG